MNLLADLQVALPDALLAGYGLGALLMAAIVGDRISVLLRMLSSFALAAAAVERPLLAYLLDLFLELRDLLADQAPVRPATPLVLDCIS